MVTLLQFSLLLALRSTFAQPTDVTVRSVSLFKCSSEECPPEQEQSVGLLRFTGGLHLLSDSSNFGGLSALRVAARAPPLAQSGSAVTADSEEPLAQSFVAVSDSAFLVTGNLIHNSNGWLTGVSNVQCAPLLGLDGKQVASMDMATGLNLQDSESLASTNDTDPLQGELLVSFERLHRVWRYNVGMHTPEAHLAVPVEQVGLGAHNGRISQCPENGGVEAMDFTHDGSLIVLCEEPVAAAERVNTMLVSTGWILPRPSTDSAAVRIHFRLSTDERPVAMARIPRWSGPDAGAADERVLGGMLVLERSWSAAVGNVLRLLFIDADTIASAAQAGLSAVTGDSMCWS